MLLRLRLAVSSPTHQVPVSQCGNLNRNGPEPLETATPKIKQNAKFCLMECGLRISCFCTYTHKAITPG